jgi:endonuclease-3
MNKLSRAEMFRRWQVANPEPETELEYASPFELLIAVILSAQATDKSVNAATAGLFAAANNPQTMRALGVDGVKSYVRTIGLFNAKSENIIKTCGALVEEHGSEIPTTREALEALPGVGRKTANVVLNTAFGQETMAVDTHIFRVSNRTGLAPGKTVRAVEDKLVKVIPKPYRRHAHHWLILHGRYMCIARRPKCGECPVSDLCDYRDKL